MNRCPKCENQFNISSHKKAVVPDYCPYCGFFFKTIIPPSTTTPSEIGPYSIVKEIGKGGMGEVFLGFDPGCGRYIALKRIRPDLLEHSQLHERFLKEARLTSQLTHPSIIPIYTIHAKDGLAYYTMPYVEGETLKQILRNTREQEKKGEKLNHLGGSIPALIRIFINICQAVAYSHSKGILHRDLKPENIIVGKFGETLILDWGLAKLINQPSNGDEENSEEFTGASHDSDLHHITRIGKVVGTINYMAPERALGHPATIQTDIYSLGVILYQLLTLRMPYRRGTLSQFKKKMHQEKLIEPSQMAPYRDVPQMLTEIVTKCLSPSFELRYSSAEELIHDLEGYIEGRSEWFPIAELDIQNKKDWEFQENILLTENIAITRNPEEIEWISLMISRASFQGNVKIEAKIQIGEKGKGIGFLIGVPEPAERAHLLDGYCVWFGSDFDKSTKLLRSTVEVVYAPEIFLQRNHEYFLCIEKIEQTIHVYLNDKLQFSYISYLPLIGTHIGILYRDADFTLIDFKVFVGSLQVTINCLAVPDAFLAQKNYEIALSEYRRIGYSFKGRIEGREAVFRAGLTLLEQAKTKKSLLLTDQALEEFEKLHNTPGAPLEYLGKALVYQYLNEYEEEIKCFELAYRRYPKHPLLPMLQEHILSRMHECSRTNRKATYHFILLALQHIGSGNVGNHSRKLFISLQKHWEPLPFIEKNIFKKGSVQHKNFHIAVQLAFWLAKPYTLVEILDNIQETERLPSTLIGNIIFSLLLLGTIKLAKKQVLEIEKKYKEKISIKMQHTLELFHLSFSPPSSYQKLIKKFKLQEKFIWEDYRLFWYLMRKAIEKNQPEYVHILAKFLNTKKLTKEEQTELDCFSLWAFFLQKDWDSAGKIFTSYPLEKLAKENSFLFFLYGCWLNVTEGEEIAKIHFAGSLPTTYPRTWTLASHYLSGLLPKNWNKQAFLWEKRELYLQLALFYHCIDDTEKVKKFKKLAMRQKLPRSF